VEEALKNRGKVNVVIAGRSRVGKSTLINAVFQGQLAETGQGRPVTQHTREISKEGIPLSVFDTRGLEMDRYRETLSELEKLVKQRRSSSDPHQHLHVAWVCVTED
jgi:predicted GTPase